jgi:hypothetical protein
MIGEGTAAKDNDFFSTQSVAANQAQQRVAITPILEMFIDQ